MDDFAQTSSTLYSKAQTDSKAGSGVFPEQLLAHYLPRLRAFVRARMGDKLRRREPESDIVQSVCRQLVEDREGMEFEVEAQFRAWLFTAALNKIRQRARYWDAEKRDADNLESLGPDDDIAELVQGYSGVFSPSRIAAAREQLARLEVVLEGLSEEDREVIALARIAGLPHAEVARRMNRTVGSMRMLLGRALCRLSEGLERSEGAP